MISLRNCRRRAAFPFRNEGSASAAFDNVFFGRMISQRNPMVRCDFLIKTILTDTIAAKCKISKHVPLFRLYKHLNISARVLCIQNMLT